MSPAITPGIEFKVTRAHTPSLTNLPSVPVASSVVLFLLVSVYKWCQKIFHFETDFSVIINKIK